jgi:cold shock protein
MATGTIKNINSDRGYGFIAPDDGGGDLFFHVSALAGLEFDERLRELRVAFDASTDERTGKPRAVNVRPSR